MSANSPKESKARLWADRCGATASEYAILLAVIAGGLVFGAIALGDSIEDTMDDIANFP